MMTRVQLIALTAGAIYVAYRVIRIVRTLLDQDRWDRLADPNRTWEPDGWGEEITETKDEK